MARSQECFRILRKEARSASATGRIASRKTRIECGKGTLLEIAEVLKTLLVLQIEKPLSFREKKMLDRARHMLITELSISRGLRECEVMELIEKALG